MAEAIKMPAWESQLPKREGELPRGEDLRHCILKHCTALPASDMGQLFGIISTYQKLRNLDLYNIITQHIAKISPYIDRGLVSSKHIERFHDQVKMVGDLAGDLLPTSLTVLERLCDEQLKELELLRWEIMADIEAPKNQVRDAINDTLSQ